MIEAVEALLCEYARDDAAKGAALLVARSAVKMNHLYEDMGFEDRKVMNRFMSYHFPELAKQRPEAIRWKKFLFDTIGMVAPACEGCFDKSDCFHCELALPKEAN